MILVSIIIPVYNQERYLPDCLASIERQTMTDFEVILVNDGSTDSSQMIIDNFCQRHPEFETLTIRQENRGQSAARNNGIRNSRGKYLFFLDSDDSISDNCLEVLTDFAEKHSADVTIGEHYDVINGRKEHVRLGFQDDLLIGNERIVYCYSERLWYNPVWNKLVKAEILKANSLFMLEGCIFEDNLWSFELANSIEVLGAIHLPTYYYAIRSGSQSTMQNNSNKAIRWLRFMPIITEMYSYIKKHSLDTNIDNCYFFMRELNYTVYGLAGCGKLSLGRFRELKKLCCFNLMCLYKSQRITIKELILYYFYHLPPIIDYVYFRFCNIVIGIKERSLEVLLKRKEK